MRTALGRRIRQAFVPAEGMVFVGAHIGALRDPNAFDERGVLLAFDAATGEFLWLDSSPGLGRGLDDFLLPITTSSPYVDADRLWYVTAQCQLRCLDTEGFRDGKNDGPFDDEAFESEHDADVVWELDMGARLGVFPHEATNCSVVAVGDVLLVTTGNGVDEAHTNVPSPRAPSFLGVDRNSGRVLWRAIGPGTNILHGQWSSPAIAVVNGRHLALFGGGDGWLRALEVATGREVWRFDGNPKEAVWRPSGDIAGIVFRNNMIGCPVVYEGRVYVAMGQDPEHGIGAGSVHAIDPGGRGDVTDSRRVWTSTAIGRSLSTPVAHGGLLFVGDIAGMVWALDARTGATVWSHDLFAAVWGSLLVVGDRLWVGDEDGAMTILRAGRVKEVLQTNLMDSRIAAAPAIADGAAYIATARTLWVIGKRSTSPPTEDGEGR